VGEGDASIKKSLCVIGFCTIPYTPILFQTTENGAKKIKIQWLL